MGMRSGAYMSACNIIFSQLHFHLTFFSSSFKVHALGSLTNHMLCNSACLAVNSIWLTPCILNQLKFCFLQLWGILPALPPQLAMPAWCKLCWNFAGVQKDGEYLVRELYKDSNNVSVKAYVCYECAWCMALPQAYPKSEYWRRVNYGPVGVSWGVNAPWSTLHRSQPMSWAAVSSAPDIDMSELWVFR